MAGSTRPTKCPAAGRSATASHTREDQDEYHASAIYSLLENEIVPMYYSGGEDGVPDEWMRRMKQCLINLSPSIQLPAHGGGVHAAHVRTGAQRVRGDNRDAVLNLRAQRLALECGRAKRLA